MSNNPIVILGATGGIGHALAVRLHAAGRRLHLVGRDAARLRELAGPLDASFSVADVLQAETLPDAIRSAGSELGGLVYAVGSIVLKPLRQVTEADHLAAYRLNVLGAALAVAAALEALKRGGGSVVLFSSVAARAGFANHSVIGPAKAAVEGLVVSLAAELAPQIRVNAVAPSLTDTAMAAPLLANQTIAKSIAALHPIQRIGLAEDSAAAAAFLLSDEASWITGQVLAVDGGRSSLRGRS